MEKLKEHVILPLTEIKSILVSSEDKVIHYDMFSDNTLYREERKFCNMKYWIDRFKTVIHDHQIKIIDLILQYPHFITHLKNNTTPNDDSILKYEEFLDLNTIKYVFENKYIDYVLKAAEHIRYKYGYDFKVENKKDRYSQLSIYIFDVIIVME